MPDPQDVATFERSRLDWSELDREPHRDMLSWYRALIALRRATPDLTNGRLDAVAIEYDEAAATLIMRRGSIILALNLGRETVLQLDASELLLRSDDAVTLSGHALQLPADSVAILRTQA